MSSVLKKSPSAPMNAPSSTRLERVRTWITSWKLNWELYLIVLGAAFLRLYQIDRTEFNGDQADIFQMAHNAVSHVHLVATSNVASIGIFNPPGIIYFLMLAAVFSTNPLAGTLLTALLSILSVLLTYVMTRRYYGRLAATIAASLYAAAAAPIYYSRFMWNQNLLLFFVPLFIFVLLFGVIERRKGWLVPAIALVGLLAQLHGSGFLLAAPLFVAFVLAPRTVRIRDIMLGALACFILYSTYLLWLMHSHYRDIPIFLTSIRRPSTIDDQALIFFQQFLSPYGFDPNDVPLPNIHSLLFRLSPLMLVLAFVMSAVLVCGAVTALILALRTDKDRRGSGERRSGLAAVLQSAVSWWTELRASPYRCAYLVLLSWQLVPLVYLLRHSIKLHSHYFIMLMPGPFLLIALFIVKMINWTEVRATWGNVLRFCLYGITVFLVATQFLGGLALVRDTTRGNFNADYNRFNDLQSLQRVLTAADQLAQRRHLKHVYISTDDIRRPAFYYLSEQMHTSTTVFDDSCAVLPSLATGPIVLLTGPRQSLALAMTERFARATLVEESARLSDDPFRLYIVDPLPQQIAKETLASDVQFLGPEKSLRFEDKSWLVTHWQLLHAKTPNSGTTYTYSFTEVQ
ncbi:MAG: glycosyltransferase family 39 protein, partial [Ktedonobacteraceae bacterium]|nr:glycosyltransferase family 39 protein [Ktedonobacteraceae bacterium]